MSTADPFALDVRVTEMAPTAPAAPQAPSVTCSPVCTRGTCKCTFNPFGCGSFIPNVC